MSENDTEITPNESLLTTASVLYDAVYVPGGINSVGTLCANPDAMHFLNQAYKHCKAIATDTAAIQVLEETYFGKKLPADSTDETGMAEGLIISNDAKTLATQFIAAIKQHRFWDRETLRKVPA